MARPFNVCACGRIVFKKASRGRPRIYCDDPSCRPVKETKSGYAFEMDGKTVSVGRLLLEEKLGRKLERGEVVRYLDGDNLNLSPANLGIRRRGHCDGCRCFDGES